MTEVLTRNDFPKLMDSLGCRTAAEIGVGAGDFSRVLLRSKIERLWMCDIWYNPSDVTAGYRAKALDVAAADPRAVIVERPSVEFAASLPDQSVDFVYLDAQHDFQHVAEDLTVWWPKMRLCLAGHDYVLWNTAANAPCGVVPSVEEFAERHGLCIHTTGANGCSPAARLRVAYDGTLVDPGPWACNFPSWWILRDE